MATTRKAPTAARQPQRAAPSSTGGGGAAGIRVRMYRVGFGDFFLLTVPGHGDI